MVATRKVSCLCLYLELGTAFEFLFSKKAYLHLFTQTGMDEMELQEAISNVYDISSFYLENQENADGEGEGGG